MIKFVNYDRGYLAHRNEYDFAMQNCLSKGKLVLQEAGEEFEENLANFVGTKYAVALNSGTDAIYLSLKSLRLEGHLVSLPSHTFKSTCGAVINAQAFPAIRDMGESLDTGYSIPVHIAGELSPIPQGVVIEDACQAFGAVKNPTTNVQCWSFYPAKILGGYGDGGAITTNDEYIADYIREARNHFKKDNRDFGINSRMDNIMAAYLNVKIKYIDEILRRRKEIAGMYLKELRNVILPYNSEERVWQDFIVITEKRDQLYEFLKKEGVETMKNEYPFAKGYEKKPIAAQYEAETLRLPCNENLTNEEVQYVIQKVNEFYDMQ